MSEEMKEALREDEYLSEETGEVRCRKCNGLRRGTFSLLGVTKTVPILCSCQAEAQKKLDAERQQREMEALISRYRSVGMTEPALLSCTFANDLGYNPESKTAKNYVEHWEEMKSTATGLLFWGGVGTGKTFLAACIANALFDKGVQVRMTNFARILNMLTDFHSGSRNELLDELNRADLLILDDVGMERNSEFAQEQVFNVIDSRYRSQRPMIVTTNLSLEEIKHPGNLAQARIFDRIRERCIPVCVNNRNIRCEKAAENMSRARELLGGKT